MNRTFVIGDIHGAFLSLQQCFERAGFDASADRLICLGDACDGWPDVAEVMETLSSLPHLVYILGNHDQWALEWIRTGNPSQAWLMQGGTACVNAYPEGMPEPHRQLLENARPFFLENDRLFVHGGFDPGTPLEEHDADMLAWDRELIQQAMELAGQNEDTRLTGFTEVYVGHTPTIRYGSDRPIKVGEIWLMDTGAGWTGPLSMMDIGTHEIFQGDSPSSLYPPSSGRLFI
ncbi:MAG TPA: serine/threonine protein phosphatase [Bacteroidetes bacterium]|nr:serine/threonine protein phosphatase [Bacteroidota bacterium]